MPITDTKARIAKRKPQPYKIGDSDAMYLLVHPSGAKYWRLKYRHVGKEKVLALGVYPETTLRAARKKRDEARELLANGVDPGEHRKASKVLREGLAANTFEVVGREWYAKTAATLAESTKEKLMRRLEVDVFPLIGNRPISELVAADIIRVIERIEQRGAVDIARRMHNSMGRIFRYAVGRGLASRDPTRDIEIKDILPPADVQHHASVTDPKAVGGLLRAVNGFTGGFTTRCALRLAALVFVRPGELRHAEWTEFDFDKSEWRIPTGKMKMKEQHIVPLSSQAVGVLREIQPLTGRGRYVFPSERGGGRPMSENTVNAALRRMGYTKDEMTGHGFRSMASTLLHELGEKHAVIERQLAHGERNKVSASYNFAEYLPERRKMMQKWADYLDKLKAGAEVITLHGQAA
ncbi:MAG: tyrosine-type recombinase/integrase [Betaproteobacteria bacterium]|nr:tyrosine-type recombinase/integrase [Betaproteobacteria bacterium]